MRLPGLSNVCSAVKIASNFRRFSFASLPFDSCRPRDVLEIRGEVAALVLEVPLAVDEVSVQIRRIGVHRFKTVAQGSRPASDDLADDRGLREAQEELVVRCLGVLLDDSVPKLLAVASLSRDAAMPIASASPRPTGREHLP